MASLRRNSVFPSLPFPDAKPKAALDPPPGVRALRHCRPGGFNTDYLLHTHAAAFLCCADLAVVRMAMGLGRAGRWCGSKRIESSF